MTCEGSIEFDRMSRRRAASRCARARSSCPFVLFGDGLFGARILGCLVAALELSELASRRMGVWCVHISGFYIRLSSHSSRFGLAARTSASSVGGTVATCPRQQSCIRSRRPPSSMRLRLMALSYPRQRFRRLPRPTMRHSSRRRRGHLNGPLWLLIARARAGADSVDHGNPAGRGLLFSVILRPDWPGRQHPGMDPIDCWPRHESGMRRPRCCMPPRGRMTW